jgi:hypothetical protein
LRRDMAHLREDVAVTNSDNVDRKHAYLATVDVYPVFRRYGLATYLGPPLCVCVCLICSTLEGDGDKLTSAYDDATVRCCFSQNACSRGMLGT